MHRAYRHMNHREVVTLANFPRRIPLKTVR